MLKREHNKTSLRKVAQHNSFFARNLKKSQRRVHALKQQIKKLQQQQKLHRTQVEKATKRADDIVSFGLRKDTLRVEIRVLEKKRNQLYLQIENLEAILKQLQLHIRNGLKRQ
tara:strand:- start:115 stop:453 length:339 start_codon:yes stop_codon:yes gene_type:complete